jgi:hypothetical protein
MDQEKTHYEVLGIEPDAKQVEVGIAYQRLMGQRRSEHAPPDPRLDAQIQEAYEVLSDADRRDYYDAELRALALRRPRAKWPGVVAVLLLAAAGYAAWHFLRPSDAQNAQAAAPEKIAQAAAPAVGKLERLLVSGAAQAPGVAFSVGEGVMVTSCRGMAPGTQLVVTLLGRRVPAEVRSLDEATGLCQLNAPKTGSWPLVFTAVTPAPGERVFSARVNPKGEVVLQDGTVRRVLDTPQGRIVEASIRVGEEGSGAPLFDSQARVVAVASVMPDGKEAYLVPPEAWRGPMTDRSAAGKAAEEAARRAAQEAHEEAQKPKAVDDVGPAARGRVPVDAERRQKLEKAFRPPPNVPDDL